MKIRPVEVPTACAIDEKMYQNCDSSDGIHEVQRPITEQLHGQTGPNRGAQGERGEAVANEPGKQLIEMDQNTS